MRFSALIMIIHNRPTVIPTLFISGVDTGGRGGKGRSPTGAARICVEGGVEFETAKASSGEGNGEGVSPSPSRLRCSTGSGGAS